MQPFFSYAGGKYKLAHGLGPPHYDTVIEPFAGSACFSCVHQPKKVILLDIDPMIIAVWKYLRDTPANEIAALPDLVWHIDDVPSGLCDAAKWLIGFWLGRGLSRPAVSPCNWAHNSVKSSDYWGPHIKQRIIRQQPKIQHYDIRLGPYWDAPDIEAFWHIDPPYRSNPCNYRFRNNNIDYAALGQWCLSRPGFIQVHEGPGADWLPFAPFAVIPSGSLRRTRWSYGWLFERENGNPLKLTKV